MRSGSRRSTWSSGCPPSPGVDRLDAYQLLTQASEVPIANVVDPNYTVLTKIRKSYLPSTDAYGGTHARLREMAAAYRSERGS